MQQHTLRTALVTGASRGIGRAIARRLAADGLLVAVHYGTDGAAAQETVDLITADGGRAFAVGAELSTHEGVLLLVEGVRAGLLAHTGGTGLDVLVNNAAVSSSGGHLQDETVEQFDRVFAVNVRAPFFLVQQLLPVLRDGGSIVNIGSAVTRVSLADELAYAMTKGAMETFTRTLANVAGMRRITVNTVAPGPTQTAGLTAAMAAMPQLEELLIAGQALPWVGQPEDVAEPVAFLASPAGRWVTGTVIDASGGTYLGPKR
ncbi:SDR family oxidoreductase [Streptomyces roseicoloratus]|uniref:SDR family oxidoreductase n=1 Tax=Streptomyces roseicoloratus TaxID=2508722 RepID=A0ABY9RYM0_9ACTN|nr:SDR family oxidoreductase [Streptomyces roseicoloratus]WMX46576.1 SDR family oxidoreductase [Streptomyces roseicoloratus]